MVRILVIAFHGAESETEMAQTTMDAIQLMESQQEHEQQPHTEPQRVCSFGI